MASLAMTVGSIKVAIADFLGYGITPANWSVGAVADITRIVQSGLRQFYAPAPIGEAPPHRWSFLRKSVADASTTSGVYTLPADYVAMGSDFILSGGNGRVPVISPAEMLAIKHADATLKTGTPKYATVRPAVPTAGSEQRWEVSFYPQSAAGTDTFSFEYYYLPDDITGSDSSYPVGGAIHADTILASCLAVAEKQEDDTEGLQHAKFIERLTSSIASDLQLKATEGTKTWQVEDESLTLDQSYRDLQLAAGRVLELGSDPKAWNHTQARLVDDLITKGLRSFYFPAAIQGKAHTWSFLTQTSQIGVLAENFECTGMLVANSTTRTLTISDPAIIPFLASFEGASVKIVASGSFTFDYTTIYRYGGSYSGTLEAAIPDYPDGIPPTTVNVTFLAYNDSPLPLDFGGLIGDLTYEYNASVHTVAVVGEGEIRRLRQFSNRVGPPEYAASRPLLSDGTSPQRHELMVFPTPDKLYSLAYKYRVLPKKLTPTEIPPGGMQHAETIRAAVEAAAGNHVGKPEFEAKYAERLASSVALDREASAPDFIGSLNVSHVGPSRHKRGGTVVFRGKA